jgi:hypothetical protein
MNDKVQKRIVYALLFLIVAIIVVTYRFGYMRYTDMADDVKKESKQIKTRIAELNEKIALRPIYEEAIVDSEQSIAEIVKKYGPGNSAEKNIIFARDLETAADGNVSSLAFTDDELVFASSGKNEEGNPNVMAYKSSLVMNYEFSYDGLKRAMDFINKYKERMTVEQFSAALNSETGAITGALTLNLYGMEAEGKAYKEPEIMGVKIGTDDIFGSNGAGTAE